MHLVLNRLQLRRRLSRSLAVRRAHAIPIANSSGVAVSMLVASRVRLREARMAMSENQLFFPSIAFKMICNCHNTRTSTFCILIPPE